MLQAATSSVREAGARFCLEVLMDVGREGLRRGGADGKQGRENGPKHNSGGAGSGS